MGKQSTNHTTRNNRKRPGRVDRARKHNKAAINRVEDTLKQLEASDAPRHKITQKKNRLIQLNARKATLDGANTATRSATKSK